MSTKEDERAKALDSIAKIFRDKLDSVAAGDDEVSSDVKAKFEQTFFNYLSTGFDVVFKKELQETSTSSGGTEAQTCDDDDQDLSVNDQQLQEMDDAINSTCLKRKFEPAKCSLFLDKTLKLQLDAAAKVKTKVRSTGNLQDTGSIPLYSESDSPDEVSEQVRELTSMARTREHKASKVEKAAQMLIDKANTN